jgi:hypothetical protein
MQAWIGWTRRGGWPRYALALLLLTLGLLSKPMLVTLPVLLLLLDFWPLGRARVWRDGARLAREKLPLLVPALAIGVVTIVVQRSSEAMAPIGSGRFLGIQLPNAVLGYVWYLEKAIWPAGLAVHYPHPYLPLAGGVPPATPVVLGSAALLIAIGVGAVLSARTRPWIAFGVAWGAIALLPVIGLLQVGTQAVADRYAYLSLVGPFVAVVWEANAQRERWRVPVVVVAALTAAVLAAYAAAAVRQAGYWQDSRTLYARGLAISPRDVTLMFNLGNAEVDSGNVREAEALYRRALEIHPGHSPTELNLADLLRRHGEPADLAEAIALYRSVLEDRPDNFRARRGLRKALATLAGRRDG